MQLHLLAGQLVARSATDITLRQRLLTDPYAAIREELGVELPPTIRVRFIERPPDVDALIVLPDLEEGEVIVLPDFWGGAGAGGGERLVS
jgi:hypothetical protein